MNIIQLGSFPLDSSQIKGGVEASVYGLALEQNKNHSITVFDFPRLELNQDKKETIDGIHVFRFKNSKGSNTSSIRRLFDYLNEIRNIQPDICHIHTGSLFALFLYLALKLKSIPVIVTIHGLAHIEKKNNLKKKKNLKNVTKYILQSSYEFILISFSKQLIVDTSYVSNEISNYKKQGKILRQPICHVIPQGVQSTFFQLKDKSTNHHIVCVGAFSERKGHLQLIDALSIVANRIKDIRVDIAGIITEQRYYELMKDRIESNQLSNHIQLHPNLPVNKILNLYEKAQLFVLHSEEESQGIVFCEAMAAGKPIVATNVGGVPYIVTAGVNGLLSSFNDLNHFAKNIIQLLEDKEECEKMALRNKAESMNYSWRTIEERIAALYKSMIKN